MAWRGFPVQLSWKQFTSNQLLLFQDTATDALIPADAGGASIFTKFTTKVSILAFGKNVPTQSSGTWGHKKVYDLLCLLIHSTNTPVSPLWCFYLRTSRLCGEVLSFREEERVERKKGGRHSIQQSHPETFLPHIAQFWFVTRIVWITTRVLQ